MVEYDHFEYDIFLFHDILTGLQLSFDFLYQHYVSNLNYKNTDEGVVLH